MRTEIINTYTIICKYNDYFKLGNSFVKPNGFARNEFF